MAWLRLAPSGFKLGRVEKVTSMAAAQPQQVYAFSSQQTTGAGSGGSVDNGGGAAGQITDTPPAGYGSDPGTIWFPPPGSYGYY